MRVQCNEQLVVTFQILRCVRNRSKSLARALHLHSARRGIKMAPCVHRNVAIIRARGGGKMDELINHSAKAEETVRCSSIAKKLSTNRVCGAYVCLPTVRGRPFKFWGRICVRTSCRTVRAAARANSTMMAQSTSPPKGMICVNSFGSCS